MLPGYWISPETILFTRFGFSQLTANRVSNGIVNEGSDSGLHFGAGIEFFINETMSFRGEYNRSTYMHEMSEIVSDTSTDPATDVQVDFRNKFRRDRFQVSMVARF
ncbi:MAG: outer membrane beta-barrel protein [Emcibacteraceae bacterium]|nr:outer membrane beta-barrel protein [Emcibacteraceae bacterium]MDG1859181.1 outer membrane beta-barrel protein [Emcibacteraceae bacterium]